MAQKPLVEGGDGTKTVATRLPLGDRARLDALVERQGRSSAEFVRAAILDALEAAEQREVSAKAS